MSAETSNPFDLFNEWFQHATVNEPSDVDAASLATVGTNGKPSIRMVLIRGMTEEGFTFYTNLGSRKADELKHNPSMALCFHWKSIARQVRIEGDAQLVDDTIADKYFASRPKESQVGAWASKQSQALPSRTMLEARFQQFNEQYAEMEVPRPAFWSGFFLSPTVFEFWEKRPYRLHDRKRFDLEDGQWRQSLLYP